VNCLVAAVHLGACNVRTASLDKRQISAAAWSGALCATVLADDDPASLDRLHDIVVPAAVPWWPPAAAWYVLIFITATAAIYFAWHVYRRRRARRYRVAALAALRALPLTDGDDSRYAAEVMALLRRTALAAWPRAEIVPLRGNAWWQFLDANVDRPAFAAELGPLSERLAYSACNDEAQPRDRLVRLRDTAAYWIEFHRVPSPRHPDAPA